MHMDYPYSAVLICMLIYLKAKTWFQNQAIARHLPCSIMSRLKDSKVLEKQCQLQISQALCPPDKEIVISEGKGQYLHSRSLLKEVVSSKWSLWLQPTMNSNQLLPWKVWCCWRSIPGCVVQTRGSLPAATCVAALGFASELPRTKKEYKPTPRSQLKRDLGVSERGSFHLTDSSNALLKYRLSNHSSQKNWMQSTHTSNQ